MTATDDQRLPTEGDQVTVTPVPVETSEARVGRCRRCGWSAPLRRLGRDELARLRADRSLSLLCADCVTDLSTAAARETSQPVAAVGAVAPRRPSLA